MLHPLMALETNWFCNMFVDGSIETLKARFCLLVADSLSESTGIHTHLSVYIFILYRNINQWDGKGQVVYRKIYIVHGDGNEFSHNSAFNFHLWFLFLQFWFYSVTHLVCNFSIYFDIFTQFVERVRPL